MKEEGVRLLDPDDEVVERIIQQHEEELDYCDKVLYCRCIEDFEKVNLCELTEEQVKGSIKVFLINWGMLSRVLERKEKKEREKREWEKDLLNVLKKHCKTLEKFRKLKLEEEDLSKFKEDIKQCYEEIRGVVRPTGASKVLHLINPEFFPMWDEKIRIKVSKKHGKLTGKRIGESGEGYYKFMNAIQELLLKKKELWTKWSEKTGKSKLRIIDIYLWWEVNKDES